VLLALALAFGAPRRAVAQCSGSTYSYGSGACASCPAGASFVSAAQGCAPSAALMAGPADTAFYLSGTAAEGVAAFAATAAGGLSFAAGPFGAASSALALASGSYLSAPGASAPAALPAGGSVAFSASAWVQCAAPSTYAAALEWGDSTPTPACTWSAVQSGYLANCPSGPGCRSFSTVAEAKALCATTPTCGGVTSNSFGAGYELRAGNTVASSLYSEVSYVITNPGTCRGSTSDSQGLASPQLLALVVAGPRGSVSTIAGSGAAGAAWNTGGYADGAGTSASFKTPSCVTVGVSLGVLFVTDTMNQRIRAISALGVVTTLAGSGATGAADGSATTASFNRPTGLAVDPSTGALAVTDQWGHRIRLVSPLGVVTTLAGSGSAAFADGTGAAASFYFPTGIAIVPSSSVVVVTDLYNNCIRLVTNPGGVVTTLAGSSAGAGTADGTKSAARFNHPGGVSIVSASMLAVADSSNNRIRLITYPAGIVTTLAGSSSAGSADGSGTAAQFNGPGGFAVLPGGSLVVVDTGNNLLRLITPGGVVTTIAGSTTAGLADGVGSNARFDQPQCVSFVSSGSLAVLDTKNNRVRSVTYAQFALPACDATWHHVALVYAPSAAPYQLSGFLDGALELQQVASVSLPSRAISALRVGWSGDLTANKGSLFAGALAELRIYARALAASEVLALSQPLFNFCAAGSFPLSTGVCAPCYPGTFSLAGAAACSLCPAGTWGASAGLASAACSGACASAAACPAGTAFSPAALAPSALSCVAADARAVPASLGLQLWPAAHPSNPQRADLVVAPLATCQQMTSVAACAAASTVVGADGAIRYVVGTAAALTMEADETLTCQ
jgi:hypothetical protein